MALIPLFCGATFQPGSGDVASRTLSFSCDAGYHFIFKGLPSFTFWYPFRYLFLSGIFFFFFEWDDIEIPSQIAFGKMNRKGSSFAAKREC